MMSDEEASDVFERETQSQFVPQEDDEEVLWEVIEITAERSKAYKVRWAGVDPKTGKPWAQSWVEKRDCTDDLVLEWRRKQALKKKKANEKNGDKRASVKSRTSAVSRVSAVSRGSTATSSTMTKRSTRQAGSTTARVNKNGKRTHADDSDSDAEVTRDATLALPTRQSKKQKVDIQDLEAESSPEQGSFQVRPPGKRKRKAAQQIDEEDVPPERYERMAQKERGLGQGKGRVFEKEEEEEESTEEENDRQGLNIPPPVEHLLPKSKPKPKANYPAVRTKTPPPPSPEAEPAYVKFKSGKVSTPRKKRRLSESTSASSSSDEVELEGPIQNQPSTPSPSPSPPPRRSSPATITRLREFDDDLQKIETAQPDNRPAEVLRTSAATLTTIKMKRTTIVTRVPNGANNVSPDSYRQGVVPETETESSNNTQSQSQSQPLQPPSQLQPPPRSPSRPTRKPSGKVGTDISTPIPDHPPPKSQLERKAVRIPITTPTPSPSPPPVPIETSGPSAEPGSRQQPARVPTLVFPQPNASVYSTPSRSSLIRKMKPRTPGSSSHFSIFGDDLAPDLAFPSPELETVKEDEEDNDVVVGDKEVDHEDSGEEKGVTAGRGRSRSSTATRTGSGALRPLPQLSPSTFTPHLPSTISSVSVPGNGDAGPGAGAAIDSEEAEVADELASSMEQIEQFSSPEKGGRKRRRGEGKEKDRANGKTRVNAKGKGKAKATDSDAGTNAEESVTDDDDGREDDVEGTVRARGLQLAERARAERVKQRREVAGESGEGRRRPLTELVDLKEKERQRQEREQAKEKEKLRWRRQKQKETESVSEEKEENDEEMGVLGLRQEEEESTQDVMMGAREMRSMEDVNMDWEVGPESGASVEVPEPDPQSHSQPQSQPAPQSQPEPQPPPEPQSEPEKEPEPQLAQALIEKEREGPVRSKSKSSSITGRSVRQQSPEHDLVLPPTAPTPSTPDVSVEADAPAHTPDFVATLALLNEKSQENAELTKEIEALRKALAAATPAAPAREMELEQELEEARTSREAAIVSLAESQKRVEDLARSKESAEKDREFFREQYGRASGFVTSVRAENVELEKQVQIAKDQVQTGVEMVKATFAARVKTLEDDNKGWRRIALFMAEKDERTNDDIRKRAAEEPELRARCEELEEDNRVMRELIDGLQEDLQDRETQVKDLGLEVGRWQKEATRLNLELSEVKARLAMLEKAENTAPKGTDMVYRCQWRPEGSNEPCDGLFLNIEELEDHLYSGGHLHV